VTVRLAQPLAAELATPPGLIVATTRPTPPPGWLPCDGTTRQIADFPSLAAALGSNFQIDASTFALPELNGTNRALRGSDGSGEGGATGGSLNHSHTWTNTLSVAAADYTSTNDGAHAHSMPSMVISNAGDHSHSHGSLTSGGSNGNINNARAGNLNRASANHTHLFANALNIGNTGANHYHNTNVGGMNTSGKHTHAPTVTNTEQTLSADNRPLFHRVYYMVKA